MVNPAGVGRDPTRLLLLGDHVHCEVRSVLRLEGFVGRDCFGFGDLLVSDNLNEELVRAREACDVRDQQLELVLVRIRRVVELVRVDPVLIQHAHSRSPVNRDDLILRSRVGVRRGAGGGLFGFRCRGGGPRRIT